MALGDAIVLFPNPFVATGEIGPTGLASDGTNLYMVGSVRDALYTLNATTGLATRVGSATQFGVNESVPTGLAFHNGTLYMLGSANDALYTLNTTTGIATRVGSATRFGVNETSPSGLASDGTNLYMLGGANDVLYTLNTTTGIATRVGSATRFGVNEQYPDGLAFHNGTLYMLGGANGVLYTLNTTTGIATRVGSATRFGVNETSPTGLASDGTNLYMVGQGTDALYTLNTTTGAATSVTHPRGYGVGESSGVILAHHNGTLYMVGRRNKVLYTLNTTTGLATRVGSAEAFGVGEIRPRGLASHNGTLYMLGESNDALYTLNTTTGLATRVGSATQFGVNESNPSGLASDGTNLYMVGQGTDALYTLNTTTGIATRVGSATRFGVNETSPSGLASDGTNLYMLGLANDVLYTLNTTTGIATRVGSATRFGVNETSPTGLAFHNNVLYSGIFSVLGAIQYKALESSWTVPQQTVETHTTTARIDFGSVVSGFTADDVRISGTADGVAVSSVASAGSAQIYDIMLSIPVRSKGTVILTIPLGSFTRTPAQFYPLVSPSFDVDYQGAVASFTGHAGTKTGVFEIGIDFAGTDAITDFQKTDINITRISGDTLADAGLNDWELTGPAQGTNNYTLEFTPANDKEGVFEISATGEVTIGSDSVHINAESVQVSYDTEAAAIEWIPEDTGGAATNPFLTQTYTFELHFGSELATPQLLVPGAFVVTKQVASHAIFVSSITAIDADEGRYSIAVSIPATSKGWFELNLPAGTVARQVGQPAQQSTDSQRVYFDTALPLWSVPSGTGTTATPTVRVDLRSSVTGFTAADIEIGGTASDGVRVFSIAGVNNSTQIYDIALLVPTDAIGTLNLTIKANSITRTPAFAAADTSPDFNVDTTDIAAWSVPADAIDTPTGTVRIDFGRAVSGFALADVIVQGSAASGVTVTDISSAGSAQIYDITLTIAEETEGDITLLIPANSVTRTPAQSNSLVSPTFEIAYTGILATFTDHTGTKRVDFDIGVDFIGTDAITNFALTNVSLTRVSGSTLAESGLTDFTLTGPTANTNNFTLHFTPTFGAAGVVELGLTGQVDVDGTTRDVVNIPVQITYEINIPPIVWTPPTDGATEDDPVTSTHIDYQVDFGAPVTGFELADVVIRTSQGVTRPTSQITEISNAQVYRVRINVAPLDSGTIQLSIPEGKVTRSPAQQATQSPLVYFNTIRSINAEFTNALGSKFGNFDIGIDFSGTGAITGLALTDISLTRVSGNTLAESGLTDFTLTGPAQGTNNFILSFTPASGVSGVVELDITGSVEVDNVPHFVRIAVVQILYDITISKLGELKLVGTTSVGIARIAAIGNTLYGVTNEASTANREAALYRVNTSTAQTERIGNAFEFGMAVPGSLHGTFFGERFPVGLTSIGSTLYMVGGTIGTLISVDIATGIGRMVNRRRLDSDAGGGYVPTVRDFGVHEDRPAGLAALGDTLYMFGNDINQAHRLYTLDAMTSRATLVRPYGHRINFVALEADDEKLYGITATSLYRMNIEPSPGLINAPESRIQLGEAVDFGIPNFEADGIALIGDTMYLVGQGRLYTIEYRHIVADLTAPRNTQTGAFDVLVEFEGDDAVTDFEPSNVEIVRILGSTISAAGLDTVTISPVANSDTSFNIRLNPTAGSEGLIAIDVTGKVTVNGQSVTAVAYPVLASYDINAAAIVWTVPTTGYSDAVPFVSRDLTFRVNFGSVVSGFAVSDLNITTSDTDLQIPAPTISSVGSAQIHDIAFNLPEQAIGWIELEIPANAVNRTPSQHQTFSPRVYFDTRTPVGVSFLGFTGVKRNNFTIRADFEAGTDAVSNFSPRSVMITRISGPDIMSAGIDDYTITSIDNDNNSFDINFSPATNISGQYSISIVGDVSVNGVSRVVMSPIEQFSIDTTIPHIGAVFQDAAGIKSSDFKIGVLFDDGADAIRGVTTSDFSVTHVSGTALDAAGLDDWSVATDPDNNRRYILTFPLSDDSVGTFQLDFADGATVNVGVSPHNVTSTPALITYDSRLGSIRATHEGPFEPGTNTSVATVSHEGFDVRVHFTTTGKITGFDTENLAQRLDDPTMDPEYQLTIVPIEEDDNSFTVQFRLGTETGIGGGISGHIIFDVTGEVLDDGRRKDVTFVDVSIPYNLPTYVRATITGSQSITTAGSHSYMINFQSMFRITNFDNSDVEITRISGDTLADAGLGSFLIGRESDSGFGTVLTFAEHTSGRIQIALTGRVDIQGIGTNIVILSDSLEIIYNTDPEIVGGPDLLAIPTISLVPGRLHTFSLDDHIFGDVDTVEISSSASWITLTGVAGDGVNRSLRYAPPSNLTVQGRFDEYSALLTAIGKGGTRQMRAYVNIFASDVAPINLIYWDLPETDMGKITSSTIVVSAIFSRALIAGETLLVSDIEIQGVTGVSVSAVSVDPLNNHKYDISLAIAQGATGVLEINIK